MMPELLSYAETQKLLDDLPRGNQKLVADLVPAMISMGGVQRVLQSLLAERVSIRDLPTILEGISEACTAQARGIAGIVAIVRMRLARQLCEAHADAHGVLPLIALSTEWETAFGESMVGPPEDRQLAMAPSRLGDFMRRFKDVFERHAADTPVLLTSPGLRAPLRAVIERIRPSTPVLAQTEIFPRARIRTIATI
jgi:flagellar biosynthesis protein FlhA